MKGSGGLSSGWILTRGDLRRRALSWAVLALLIGVAGAFVVVTAAGSRRTSSSYDRFLAVTEPFDLIAIAFCDESTPPDSPECRDHQAKAVDTVRSLPQVEEVGVAHNHIVPILKEDGTSIQPDEAEEDPCFSGNGEVDIQGSFDDNLGTTLVRRRFVEGRAADQSRRDEVVLSLSTARREGIEVGDRLAIVPVVACEGPPESEWPAPITVTVVGLHLTPGEVQPERGRYLQSLTVTPPLLADLQDSLGVDQTGGLVVQLADGASAEELVEAASRGGLPLEVVLPREDLDEQVRDGLRPDAFGLSLLSILGAATAFVVLAQAIVRQLWAGAVDHGQLRAVGFTSRGLALIGALQAGVLGLVAAGVAVVLAVVGSSTMPIGRARTIEPDPGLDVDVATIALGGIGIAVATAGIGLVAARWIASRTTTPSTPVRVSRLAGLLAALGASPQAVSGARMAFERRHGARAVPVVSGLGGAVVGIAALLGSLTFSSSLDHLLSTPRLVGWSWDGMAFLSDEAAVPPDDPRFEQLLEDVRAIDGVSRASYGTLFPAFDDPVLRGTTESQDAPGPLLVTFSAGPGAVEPTVVEGRAPNRADEVMLTRALAEELGLEVGDTVEVHGRSFTDEDPQGIETSQEVTLVGIGVFPVGDGSFERSLSLTFEGLRELAAHAQPHVVFLELENGADLAAGLQDLESLGLQTDDGPPGEIAVVELVDLDVRRADGVPTALGALMAVLGIGVLAHLVLVAVRTRGREMATLRTLGMVRWQLAQVVTWQTALVMLVISSTAAFAGAVVGREVWLHYARRLGVVPEASLPLVRLALALAVFSLVAIVIARLACRRASGRSPGGMLRAE